jgi:hypothetical protein
MKIQAYFSREPKEGDSNRTQAGWVTTCSTRAATGQYASGLRRRGAPFPPPLLLFEGGSYTQFLDA